MHEYMHVTLHTYILMHAYTRIYLRTFLPPSLHTHTYIQAHHTLAESIAGEGPFITLVHRAAAGSGSAYHECRVRRDKSQLFC